MAERTTRIWPWGNQDGTASLSDQKLPIPVPRVRDQGVRIRRFGSGAMSNRRSLGIEMRKYC
jgi:hypothetical protein